MIIKMNHIFISLTSIIISLLYYVEANLWCYSCVSTQPGCTEDAVNWWIHSAITCPKADDKCIKIIDRKGSDIQVTRDCLSNIVGHRRDIPADRFEGCRPAAAQPKLAVYVENSVRELNLKNDYWDATTYCFCEFDEWCNSQTRLTCNFFIIIFALALSAFLKLS